MIRRPMDYGYEKTEAILYAIEARIAHEYAVAEREIQEKLDDYLRRFRVKDELKRKALANGVITQAEYDYWRTGQIMVGERWTAMRDAIAMDFANVSQNARSIAYREMPRVYALNYNYASYEIDFLTKGVMTADFTLYSKEAVAHLFQGGEFYHSPGQRMAEKIAMGKQLAWDKKQVQSVMMQGIMQGESIPNLSTRLAKTVGDSDRKAAIRNTRTMVTGVQNAGRTDSIRHANSTAEKYGLKVLKQWCATLDGRTRDWHVDLDGEAIPEKEMFVNEYGEIEYPGDPGAEPANIYNCRCTLLPCIEGLGFNNSLHPNETGRELGEDLGDISYEEWKDHHYTHHSEPITRQDEIAEIMQRKYGNEYRSYRNLPDVLQKGATDGIIAGAISGALDPMSAEAQEHADRYYGLVRSMTTDVERIANATGFSKNDIQRVKDYIFMDEHDLVDGRARFDPSYDMAESWQRLISGNYKPHDLTLLNHELMEMRLVNEGMSQALAHIETSRVYNYTKEVKAYNDSIKKNRK